MLNNTQVNAIGNFLDFSLNHGPDDQLGVTYTLQGDVLSLRFSTIVHFASERSMRDQTVVLADESMQKLKGVLSALKKDFKDKAGVTLIAKEISNKDNLELIQATSNSPRKIAYYRRFIDIQVDA